MMSLNTSKEVSALMKLHEQLPVKYVHPSKRITIEAGNAVGKTSQLLLFMAALKNANISYEGIKGGGLHDAELIANQSNLKTKRVDSGKLIAAAQKEFLKQRKNVDQKALFKLVLNLYTTIAQAELTQDHLLILDRCTAISQALGLFERTDFNTLSYLYQQLPHVFLGGLIVIDADEDEVIKRMKSRGLGEEVDKDEISRHRHQYLEVANQLSSRSIVVNGNGDVKQVHTDLIGQVNDRGWVDKKLKPVSNPDRVLKRINK